MPGPTLTIDDSRAAELRGQVPLDSLAPTADDEGELRADYEALRIALALACERLSDVDATAERLVEAVTRIVPVGRAALLVVDRGTGELAVCRARGEGAMTLSRLLLDTAARERCAVLTRDVMVAPLTDGERDVGVLYAGATDGRLSEQDLRRFAWLARRAAEVLAELRRRRESTERAGERARLVAQFAPELVESVIAGRSRLAPEGALRDVTALFVDLRGSQFVARHGTVSEPDEMLRRLNAHFERMTELVFRHGGWLGQSFGDSVFALFGGPAELEDAPSRAIRCALAMREAVVAFARSPQAGTMRASEVAVGIASGPALVGALGSANTRRFTAIGGPVNLAAKLCREAGSGDIVIDETTRDRADPALQVERREARRDGMPMFAVAPRSY